MAFNASFEGLAFIWDWRLLRSTRHYCTLLDHSLMPGALSSGLTRNLLLHACCHDSMVTPKQALLEASALEQGDIPLSTAGQPPAVVSHASR